MFYNMSVRNLFSLSIRPPEKPVSAAHVSEIPGWNTTYLASFKALTCIPVRQHGTALVSPITKNHKPDPPATVPPQKVRSCKGIQFLIQGVAIYVSVLEGFGIQSLGKRNFCLRILVWRSSQTGATAKEK